MLTEVTLGVVGAVVVVHGTASFSLKNSDLTSIDQQTIIKVISFYTASTALGTLLILWGLVGKYLKTVDAGLLSLPESLLIQVGAYIMIFLAILPSATWTAWLFVINPSLD